MMFQDYIAKKQDLEAIEKAIEFVNKPEMRFVFSDYIRINKTLIVSYDSKRIFYWGLNGNSMFTVPHDLKITDNWQKAWWASLVSNKLKKYLPKKRSELIVNGGLLNPFISLQKLKQMLDNPYITKNSYLATILHEFGHIYYGGYGKNAELFASCTEYYAAQLYWPDHAKNLNKLIQKVTEYYKGKIPKNNPHIFALHETSKLISSFPNSWPKKLMNLN